MASIVYFQRTEDDVDSARYVFGRDKDNMTRTLLLDKTIKQSRPDDENADGEFQYAALKIYTLYRDRGEWPKMGAFVS